MVPTWGDTVAVQVAEAIRVSPRPMPMFGLNEFRVAHVSAIAPYTEYGYRADADRYGRRSDRVRTRDRKRSMASALFGCPAIRTRR